MTRRSADRPRPRRCSATRPTAGASTRKRHLATYAGILQANAYAGFGELYHPGRKPGPVTEAGCWAHGRRKLFDLAQLARAPLAAEAVRRIDAIFDAERTINGLPAEQRLSVRQDQVTPLVADLETWMRAARSRMSRHAEVGRVMDYMLKRWDTFSRFLHDGRICLSNNAAERALRDVALSRKAWLLPSDRGGERAAAIYTLILTAKLNGVDPRAWLAEPSAASPIIPPRGCTSCSLGTMQRPRPMSKSRPDDSAKLYRTAIEGSSSWVVCTCQNRRGSRWSV